MKKFGNYIKVYEKNLGIKLSTEKDIKLALKLYCNIDLEETSIEDWLNLENAVCNDNNYNKFLDPIAESLAEGYTEEEKTEADHFAREMIEKRKEDKTKLVEVVNTTRTTYDMRSLQENTMEKLLLRYTDNFDIVKSKQNCLTVLRLYQDSLKNPEFIKNPSIANGIEEFVKAHAEVFIDVFGDNIFTLRDHKINEKVMRNTLKANEQVSIDRKNFENLTEATKKELVEKYQEEREKFSEELKQINEVTTLDKTQEILKIFNDSNLEIVKYLNRDEIEKIRNLKNEEVNEILDDVLVFDRDDEMKIQKLQNSFLLIEAKKELFRGQPEFLQMYLEGQNFYESSDALSKCEENSSVDKDSLQKKIEEFVNKEYEKQLPQIVFDKSINKEFFDENDQKGYEGLLLAGLESNNLQLRAFAIEELKKIYTNLSDVKDNNKIRKEIYKSMFGITKESEIERKSQENQMRLKREIIKNTEVKIPGKFLNDREEGKIQDSTFENSMKNEVVEINVDLTKGVVQNLFKNSKINFKEKDEKLFEELYNYSITKSWIDNGKDAKIMKLLSLLKVEEVMESNKDNKLYNGSTGVKTTKELITELLNENPELRDVVFDKKGNVKDDISKKGEEFRSAALQTELLENIKKALTDSSAMTPRQRLNSAILAYSMSHPPKKGSEKEINTLLEKLGNRIFEKLSTEDKPLIHFDEKGKAILEEDNIKDLYNELTQRKNGKFNSFDEICRYEETRNNTFGGFALANRYTALREDDKVNDYEMLSEIESVEEKKAVLNKLQSKRCKERAIKKVTERRFKIIEEQVSVLSIGEIKALKNENLEAIWYNLQIKKEENISSGDGFRAEFKNKYSKDLDSVMTVLKRRFSNMDYRKTSKENDMEEIERILLPNDKDGNVFKKLIEKNKIRENRRKNNLKGELKKDVKFLNKKDIEQNENITINGIWYSEKISELRSLRVFEEADKLEVEFQQKFKGQKLKDVMDVINTKITDTVENTFYGINGKDTEAMKMDVFGEDAYIYANSLKKVARDINFKQRDVAKDEIENIIKSGMSYDEKVTRLANMYKIFSCDKENKEESQIAMQMIVNKMQYNKYQFEDFINSDRSLDIDKLLTYTDTKKYGMSKICNSVINKMHDVEKRNQTQKAKVRKIYDYFYSEEDSKKDPKAIQELIEDALEEKLITSGIQNFFEANNPELYKAARENIAQIDKTSWIDMAKRGIQLGKNAVLNLPKLLRKEGREEFANKFSTHFKSGTRKVGMKTRRSLKELNGQNKTRRRSPKMQKALFNKKTELLGPAQDVEKETTIPIKPEDKAQNNQTEKIDYLNSQQFQGRDNGVFQKMQETQKSQENQSEKENSDDLKKAIIADEQEIE